MQIRHSAFRRARPRDARVVAALLWTLAAPLSHLMAVVATATPAPAHPGEPAGQKAAAPASNPASAPAAPAPGAGPLYIREYRVLGAHTLPRVAVEEAVYPYLGPGRSEEDVEHARAALEKAYQDKGFQTVTVQVPPQQAQGGVVFLQVVESKVGKLRVNGARYFLPDRIKAQAQSLAEGKVVDFNQVTRDIVALNQLPDRQVTPSVRPGLDPGTVDIDLNVKDTLPLHGSLELNNRYSANTTPLRLNGSVSYANLWQAGQSAGFSFQIAPQNISDVEVFSAYYMLRFPNIDWLSLMLEGTKQNSNVNTLGSLDVAGRGEVVGLRAVVTLPPGKNFYHSASFGIDYKHFDEGVGPVGAAQVVTPTSYYPISGNYNATWTGKSFVTAFDAGVTLHLRGLGSDQTEFDNSRFKSDGDFIYLRGDLSHTQDLPTGAQVFAKVQGQVADQPLLNSEQFSAGGLGTVRGYLESSELGDNALFGTLELRSPSLLGWWHRKDSEWRVYVFSDGGFLTVRSPLPGQVARFDLASYGVGSRLRLWDHLNGSVDLGVPLISQAQTTAHDLLLTFRVWAEF